MSVCYKRVLIIVACKTQENRVQIIYKNQNRQDVPEITVKKFVIRHKFRLRTKFGCVKILVFKNLMVQQFTFN